VDINILNISEFITGLNTNINNFVGFVVSTAEAMGSSSACSLHLFACLVGLLFHWEFADSKFLRIDDELLHDYTLPLPRKQYACLKLLSNTCCSVCGVNRGPSIRISNIMALF
jgi:hypothetical protein